MAGPPVEFKFESRERRGRRCDRPVINLEVSTAGFGLTEFQFIFDTGCDWSFFPVSLAKTYTIAYPTDARLLKRNIGLKGERVAGYLGKMICQLALVKFELPTIFYFPTTDSPAPNATKQETKPTPGKVAAKKPIPNDPDDWAKMQEKLKSVDARAASLLLEMDKQNEPFEGTKSLFDDPPLLLGRAEFLDKFEVILAAGKTRIVPVS